MNYREFEVMVMARKEIERLCATGKITGHTIKTLNVLSEYLDGTKEEEDRVIIKTKSNENKNKSCLD